MEGYPQHSIKFDWLINALGVWFLGGLYVDGWAHNHLDAIDTFFTPWHAILYSGFFAITIVLAYTAWRNHKAGFSWMKSLPKEYHLSLIGAGIFMASGMLDALWHFIFGIEASVDALLSPTHLLLALGGTLMVSGTLRGLWHQDMGEKDTSKHWAAILSLMLLLAFFTFMTQFIHPYSHIWAAPAFRTLPDFHAQAMGIASVLFQTSVLIGLILTTIRRWRMPVGSFTFILTINAFALSFMQDHYSFIASAFVAGIFIDFIYNLFKADLNTVWIFRLFAFLVPLIWWTSYFMTVLFTQGIWWSIHLAVGTPALAAIVGWLMTFMVVPPGATKALES